MQLIINFVIFEIIILLIRQNCISMENKNLLNFFSTQVNLYLDNRLTEESKENLLRTVNEDPECQQVFRQEKVFRDFIRNHTKRQCASEELINTIRNKII